MVDMHKLTLVTCRSASGISSNISGYSTPMLDFYAKLEDQMNGSWGGTAGLGQITKRNELLKGF